MVGPRSAPSSSRVSRSLLSFGLVALLAAGCQPTPQPVEPSEAAVVDIPTQARLGLLDAEGIRGAVAFLADDAQQGRPPGTDADARVRAWVIERMQAAGLETSEQSFSVGAGAALREGASSGLAPAKKLDQGIAHAIVPFGHDTSGLEGGAVTGKLVFVGYGIAGEGEDAGDFAKVDVKGAIVVALAGAADPHASRLETRAQSKLIAARDRGAVGFVLWEPNSDRGPAGRGPFGELEIPAVFVGKTGSEALAKALRIPADGAGGEKRGANSRKAYSLSTPIEAVTLDTANVVGVLPGSAPEAQRRQIYVGAHLDHLGMGTASSLAPGEHAVHNGADDNASGVAVILAMAEALAQLPADARPHDLVFVAFGAEELGLLGSQHMVEAMAPEQRERIVAMLNFDMVGRLRDNLLISGVGTAPQWEALLADAQAAVQADGASTLTLETQASGWGPSDHASFYGEGVPVLHFFTGAHEDYHKPSDDLDKLDFAGAAAIGDLAGRVAVGLMAHENLDYVKTERPKQGGSAFRVSLGTMPDYGRDVDGMALGGVRDGGPAANAGLQKGDVITRIGEREIHNIDDYMAAFGELEPGVEVEVGFTRDGAEQTTRMTPAAPRR
ncbi:M20/M25/M40 family metallo-hydrolase [Plesiocystis pacifica]|uniref:M20/M25/M40 family metallo-hydrolase n=1 Tax=Plesiocystis pacifica TaxID=191768 RepID=UPI000A3049BD|nr:M20/M25/M40 family metallo-hydrolase [Plesiocystis pacifica]